MIGDGYSLDQIQNLNSDSAYYQDQISVLNIRLKAVQEAAEALGMQAGLYDRSQQINAVLNQHAATLDQVFNFNLLTYKQHVLPPVIEHAGPSLNVGPGNTTLRIDGETYNVVRQVKFVTVPPTWRDYLFMDYKKPDLPNKVLLPRNDKEKTIWKKFTQQGWQEGEDQGIVIFKMNISRLQRDYNGMVLYKSLLLQGMVSPFYVTSKDNGVIGNANHLVINDQSMAISTFPELQIHSQLWDPVITNQTYQSAQLPPPPPPAPVIIRANNPDSTGGTSASNPAPIVTAQPIVVLSSESNGNQAAIEQLPSAAPIATAKPFAK